jgi:hypothetical protein
MRRVRPLVALAIAGVMLLPSTVTAAPTVSITGVTVTGGTGSVTGTAAFEAITTAQSVVSEDESTFGGAAPGNSAAGDAIGLDIQNGTITPIPGGLRFTWIMGSMPPQVPPEGVRYTWAFKIGNNMYQLQAKRTNVASVSTLEDPMGHVQALRNNNNFFQLRGACVENYFPDSPQPVNGCYHLAWLSGTIDPANKTVSIDLPFETKDEIGRSVAPDFRPGAVLVDNGGTNTAGMVISASAQAVVSNTNTAQFINGIKAYHVGPQVVLGVAAPNQDPATITYSAPGVLNGSTFNGTVTGLTASKNTVYAKACNGTECSYSTFKAL